MTKNIANLKNIINNIYRMNEEDIKKIQEELRKGKPIISYNTDEIRYIQKPIGEAIYKSNRGRPKKLVRATPNDRVMCEICNKEFIRAGRSRHNKTELHQKLSEVNKNMSRLVLGEDKKK